MHLYEEKGIDCVRELNGMFAFAIWDARTRPALPARATTLGEKPLYYTTAGRQFLFASELKALLRRRKVSREIDPAALDDYLALRLHSRAPHHLPLASSSSPAAHRLLVRDGGMRARRATGHPGRTSAWT